MNKILFKNLIKHTKDLTKIFNLKRFIVKLALVNC